MKCYASTLVMLCKQETGYKEKKTNSNLEDKEANAGSANWNKYADYIDKNFPEFYNGKKNGYEWCDVYVDAMMIKAFDVDNALRLLCQPKKSCGAGVKYSYQYYQAAKRTSTTPSIGAQAFFKNSSGAISHTGIVIGINGNMITVSEGNSSNGVREVQYAVTDTKIYGYGVPDYDPEPTEETSMGGTLTVDARGYDKVEIICK